jgi:hypothetical protein
VVGDGEGFHAVGGGFFEQAGYARSSVEERELGVAVEVCEVWHNRGANLKQKVASRFFCHQSASLSINFFSRLISRFLFLAFSNVIVCQTLTVRLSFFFFSCFSGFERWWLWPRLVSLFTFFTGVCLLKIDYSRRAGRTKLPTAYISALVFYGLVKLEINLDPVMARIGFPAGKKESSCFYIKISPPIHMTKVVNKLAKPPTSANLASPQRKNRSQALLKA